MLKLRLLSFNILPAHSIFIWEFLLQEIIELQANIREVSWMWALANFTYDYLIFRDYNTSFTIHCQIKHEKFKIQSNKNASMYSCQLICTFELEKKEAQGSLHGTMATIKNCWTKENLIASWTEHIGYWNFPALPVRIHG